MSQGNTSTVGICVSALPVRKSCDQWLVCTKVIKDNNVHGAVVCKWRRLLDSAMSYMYRHWQCAKLQSDGTWQTGWYIHASLALKAASLCAVGRPQTLLSLPLWQPFNPSSQKLTYL